MKVGSLTHYPLLTSLMQNIWWVSWCYLFLVNVTPMSNILWLTSVSRMMVFSIYNKLFLYFRGPFDSTYILVYMDAYWLCEPFADYLQIMAHVPIQGLLNHRLTTSFLRV